MKKRGCLKTTPFSNTAGFLLNSTTHIHTGMQETKLLIPAGSALRWTARQHDSALHGNQVQLIDHSSWQCTEYEENDITMKAEQQTKIRKNLRRSWKYVRSSDLPTTKRKTAGGRAVTTDLILRKQSSRWKKKKDRESCQWRVLNQCWNQHRKENNPKPTMNWEASNPLKASACQIVF